MGQEDLIDEDSPCFSNAHPEMLDSKEAIREMIESRNKIDMMLNTMCLGEASNDKSKSLSRHSTISKLGRESLEKIQKHLKESKTAEDYVKKLQSVFMSHREPIKNMEEGDDVTPFNTDSNTIQGASIHVPMAWIRTKNAQDSSNNTLEKSLRPFKSNPIIINGTTLNSSTDYEDALEYCVSQLQKANTLSDSAMQDFAEKILEQASHKACTGKTDDVIKTLLCNDDDDILSKIVDVKLQPGYVQPIELLIDVGKYGDYWGVGATIEASYLYLLSPNTEELEEEQRRVDKIPLRLTLKHQVYPNVVFRDDKRVEEDEPEDEASSSDDIVDIVTVTELVTMRSTDISGICIKSKTAQPYDNIDEKTRLAQLYEKRFGYEKADYVEIYQYDFNRPTIPVFCRSPLGRNRITKVASSAIHSLFLSDLGEVFSSGENIDGALGHGDSFARGRPGSLGESNNYTTTEPRPVEFFYNQSPRVLLQDVSCGGDTYLGYHSAVVTDDGFVYTWGNGVALGLGTTRPTGTPTKVEGKLATVSCTRVVSGGNFCIALSNRGELYSWGQWQHGRLGQGKTPYVKKGRHSRKQLVRYQLHPEAVMRLQGLFITDVSCGTAHAVAIDSDGQVYAWGKGGHGQLGNGDTSDRVLPEKVTFNDATEGSPSRLKFRKVSCGHNFTLVLDDTGGLWSWGANGSGATGHGGDDTSTYIESEISRNKRIIGSSANLGMPKFDWLNPRKVAAFEGVAMHSISAGTRHGASVSVAGDLYYWKSTSTTDGANEQIQLLASESLGDKVVESISCSQDRIVAITSGSFLGQSMRSAFQSCLSISPFTDISFQSESDAAVFDQASCSDIVLIVAGRKIFAHKLVLSQRSVVLRDMILEEERPGRATELILPQIRYEVALLLIEYLYCDNFYTPLDPSTPTPRDLLDAARTFKLKRLQDICKSVIALEFEDFVENCFPSSELCFNLGGALGSRKWSDVAIIAENKRIYAHKCILQSRSAYFNAMFNIGMRESFSKELVVTESYHTILRLLTFIYTDTIRRDSTDDDLLLDDLVAADKYGLDRMKLLVENSIVVTHQNCINTLAIADIVHASQLKEASMKLLSQNLNLLYDSDAFKELISSMPHLQHSLLKRAQVRNNRGLLMDWNENVYQKQVQRELESKQNEAGFPWLHYAALAVVAMTYGTVTSTTVLTGMTVPILNALLVIGFLCYAFYTLGTN